MCEGRASGRVRDVKKRKREGEIELKLVYYSYCERGNDLLEGILK